MRRWLTPALQTALFLSAPLALADPAPSTSTAPTTNPTAAEADLRRAALRERIRAGADRYKAQLLVEDARRDEAADRLADALRKYDAALRLDPGNEAARDAGSRLRTILNIAEPRSSLDEERTTVTAKRGLIRYRFDTALARFDRAVTAWDFATARDALAEARNACDSDPTLFLLGERESRDFEAKLTAARLRLARAEAEAAREKAKLRRIETGGGASVPRETARPVAPPPEVATLRQQRTPRDTCGLE